jgi:hypothetical protein
MTDTEIGNAAKKYAESCLDGNELLVWQAGSDRTREELFPHVIQRYVSFLHGALWAQGVKHEPSTFPVEEDK